MVTILLNRPKEELVLNGVATKVVSILRGRLDRTVHVLHRGQNVEPLNSSNSAALDFWVNIYIPTAQLPRPQSMGTSFKFLLFFNRGPRIGPRNGNLI